MEYPQEIIDFLHSAKSLSMINGRRKSELNRVGKEFLSLLKKYSIEKPIGMTWDLFARLIVSGIEKIPKCSNDKCSNETAFRFNLKKRIFDFKPYCCMRCYKECPKAGKKISGIKKNLYSDPVWKNETLNKSKKTCLEKFGTENPMQNATVFGKQMNSSFRNAVRIGDLRMIGFEPYIYDYFKNGYNSICSGTEYLRSKHEQIKWVDDSGKEHRAFPDFFIEDENAFVEVKSEYTRKIGQKKLVKIIESINKMGYNYFIVTLRKRSGFNVIHAEPYLIEDARVPLLKAAGS